MADLTAVVSSQALRDDRLDDSLEPVHEGYQLFAETYAEAVQKVAGYRLFLKQNHLTVQLPIQSAEIKNLPIMTKQSYIHAFELHDLFPDQKIPTTGHMSTGSSGKRTTWFRGEKQLAIGSSILDTIFKKIFVLNNNEPTLIIVSFAMGMWVAGTYIMMACNQLLKNTARYNQFTVLTPGGDINDVLYLLKEVAPKFKNIVLFGYPPLISRIFSEANERNIAINNSFYIITAGASFSEEWREQMLDTLNLPYECADHIIALYASADAGIMAHETPFSIKLRRLLRNNLSLKKMVLNLDSSYLPFIGQYYTDKIYFEAMNDELLLTANLDIPLIRYNTRDVGEVYSLYNLLKTLLSNSNFPQSEIEPLRQLSQQWTLPFLTVKWRSDVVLNFNCAKIPADFIMDAIKTENAKLYLSGFFLAYVEPIVSGEIFYLTLEMSENCLVLSERQKSEIIFELVCYLRAMSSEYDDVCKNIGVQHASPQVDFISFGESYDQKLKATNSPKILALPNKKPCLVL